MFSDVDKQDLRFLTLRGKAPLPLTGGCQCGAVRYEITADPLSLYVCHCTECQKQTGSAFGMSMPVASRAFRFTRGETKEWIRKAVSGRTVVAVFCPTCGTRVLHKSDPEAAIVNVKPGTLDNTGWIEPVGHIWTDSAQGWTCHFQDGVTTPRQPDDLSPLYKAWQAE